MPLRKELGLQMLQQTLGQMGARRDQQNAVQQQQDFERQQQQQAMQAAQQEQQKQAAAQYLQHLIASHPGHEAEIIAANQSMVPQGVNMPKLQQTPEEELASLRAGDALGAWKGDPNFHGLAPGAMQAGRYNSAYGAPAPSDLVKGGAAVATYQNPQALPPTFVNRQLTEDKLVPSAPDKLTAQTAITTTGMQGQAQRAVKGMEIAAEAPLRAAQTAEAQSKAAGATGTVEPFVVNGKALTGQEAMNALSPGMQATVKRFLDYTSDPKGLSTRNNYRKQIMDVVHAVDPSYEESQYESRAKLRKEYTPSGPTGKVIISANKVLNHLDTLDKAIDELGNMGGVGTPLNAPANWIGSTFGGVKQHHFTRIRDAASTELAKFLQGGGQLPESAVKEWKGATGQNASPADQKQAVKDLAELMYGQLVPLANAYASGMGKPLDYHILDDTSASFLKRLGHADVGQVNDAATLGNLPGTRQNAPAAPPSAVGSGAKTITRAELARLGGTEAEARAEGLTVVP